MAEPKFGVYKVSKEVENSSEMVAKFETKADADEFAHYEQANDPGNDFEYIVDGLVDE